MQEKIVRFRFALPNLLSLLCHCEESRLGVTTRQSLCAWDEPELRLPRFARNNSPLIPPLHRALFVPRPSRPWKSMGETPMLRLGRLLAPRAFAPFPRPRHDPEGIEFE
jgi:hypothetical protein